MVFPEIKKRGRGFDIHVFILDPNSSSTQSIDKKRLPRTSKSFVSCHLVLLTLRQMKPYHWSIQKLTDIIPKWLNWYDSTEDTHHWTTFLISDKSIFLVNSSKNSKCARAKQQNARKSPKLTLDTKNKVQRLERNRNRGHLICMPLTEVWFYFSQNRDVSDTPLNIS